MIVIGKMTSSPSPQSLQFYPQNVHENHVSPSKFSSSDCSLKKHREKPMYGGKENEDVCKNLPEFKTAYFMVLVNCCNW